VDEQQVEAIASSLTNLQHLSLQAPANISGEACLAATAQLTQLTNLHLVGGSAVDCDALALLRAKLHKLQRCCYHVEHGMVWLW
jgi:hypothetical protein